MRRLEKALPNFVSPSKRLLSPGGPVGCTLLVVNDVTVLVYIDDGCFHLKSAVIANPNLRANDTTAIRNSLRKNITEFQNACVQ